MPPVLIGSRACGAEREDSDYDIISSKDLDLKGKVDYFRRPFDISLYIFLNTHLEECTEVTIQNIKFLVPKKEYIAMIYLSSLYRIIPYSSKQSYNIEIHLKRIRTYNKLRSELNYVEFDRDLESNKFIGINFRDRVNNKFKTYGDTKQSLEKSDDKFFDDTVPRLIGHDELHEKVADMCRGTKTLLFKEIQDKNNVSLNKKLFDAKNTKFKIAMIQEEIIVLMLERNILQSLKHAQKYEYDQILFTQQFYEVAVHFATNLCGQGFYFLRKYVLDHFVIIMETMPVSQEKIVELGYTIAGIKKEEIMKKPVITDEMKKLYKIISDKINNTIYESDGCVLNLELGQGITKDKEKFFLEISMFPHNLGVVFKAFVESKSPIEEIDMVNKEIVKTEKLTNVIYKMNEYGNYSSVNSCEFFDPDAYNFKTVHKNHTKEQKQEVSTYINTFGKIEYVPQCEKIAQMLLSHFGTHKETKEINDFEQVSNCERTFRERHDSYISRDYITANYECGDDDCGEYVEHKITYDDDFCDCEDDNCDGYCLFRKNNKKNNKK